VMLRWGGLKGGSFTRNGTDRGSFFGNVPKNWPASGAHPLSSAIFYSSKWWCLFMAKFDVLPIEQWSQTDPSTGVTTLCDPFLAGVPLDPTKAPYGVQEARPRGIEWMTNYGRRLGFTAFYGLQEEALDLGPLGLTSPFDKAVLQADMYLYATEGMEINPDEPYASGFSERLRMTIRRPYAPPSAQVAITDAATHFERAMFEMDRAVMEAPDDITGVAGSAVFGHYMVWDQFSRIGVQAPTLIYRNPRLLEKWEAGGFMQIAHSNYAPRTHLTTLLRNNVSAQVYEQFIDSNRMPEMWRNRDLDAVLRTGVIAP
jgi:hypothetical protein